MIEVFLDRYVYLFVLALLCIGMYGMLAKGDLVKKVIGLTILQTAIFLFFIQGSLQRGGTVPIRDPDIGSDPSRYVDPVPHLLILTAIVVGVGVLGVALALLVRIYRVHGSLDEAVVAARLAGVPRPGDDTDGTSHTGGTGGPDRSGGRNDIDDSRRSGTSDDGGGSDRPGTSDDGRGTQGAPGTGA